LAKTAVLPQNREDFFVEGKKLVEMEWVALMLKAKEQGISVLEIRNFLKNPTNNSVKIK
jgi:hypothetical protein